VSRIIVSEEFLLWSQMCALWAVSSYAIAPDPLPEDRENLNFSWQTWKKTLPVRIVGTALISYWITHSIVACVWMTTIITIHPWTRLRSPLKWTAEMEVLVLISNSLFMLAFVRHFRLRSHSFVPAFISTEHFCAVLVVGATLLFVIRGGTYIVRGCLRKTGTLPHIDVKNAIQSESSNAQGTVKPAGTRSQTLPGSLPDTEKNHLDVKEINRGRLIGNLERLVLTIVVAAGSYAALAFLVAAKGLIRSEDLQNRDFAEYFLVGSLSSVLVALCSGVVIRYTLLALWPELLSLQMQ
jgi:hypothetical protein